jgi:hypothetical protein
VSLGKPGSDVAEPADQPGIVLALIFVIPAALNFDSWGDSTIGRVLIHWRGEDSRHASCGEIADGLFGR